MFESKINRGRANGYAPLDSGSKVPLSYLPPIQSTIDTGSFVTNTQTGSFATTGSNTFIGEQTISTIQGTGSLYLKPDVNDNRHFEIYNTSPSDTHIKANGGLSFFGDDTNYLKIDDGNSEITLRASSTIILETGNGDIILNPDSGLYKGSAGIGNALVTEGNLDSVISSFVTNTSFNEYTASVTMSANIDTSSLATTGSNTFVGNQTIDGTLTISTPSAGIPNGVSNWNGQGGWNQGFYSNLTTTGGTGEGLTVDVAAGGGGYINIEAISINTPGSGYSNGDIITIDNENNLPGEFTISIEEGSGWIFDTSGSLSTPGDINVNGSATIEGGYLILTGSTTPTNLSGSIGDMEGMVVFDDNYLYYCTADFVPETYQIIVSNGLTYDTHVTIAKNQPGASNLSSNGWSITTPGDVTYVLTGVYSDGDNWDCEIDNLNSNYNGGTQTMTLTDLNYTSVDIWKRVSLNPLSANIISSSAQIASLGFTSESNDQTLSTTSSVQFHDLTIDGTGSFQSDVTIYGNLQVWGTQSVINSTNVELSDNILYLAPSGGGDFDLGIVGHYNDGTYSHTGIFSDASDGHAWKVFKGLITETTGAYVDTNGAGYTLADFKANNIYGGIYATNGVVSGSSQVLGGSGIYSSSAQLPSGLISGSSQLTASYDTRYTLSGSVVSGTTPAGTISGSSQLTSSFDGRYTQTGSFNTLTASFNSFTASAQSVTTGSNSFNGTQTITGSLIISTGSFIGSQITANTASLYLTSGSNLYVQNNGLVEITGSLAFSGSSATINVPVLNIGTGSGDEGGEIQLAKPQTNNSITGSGITIDSFQNKIRIFENGGNTRGGYFDISSLGAGVGTDLSNLTYLIEAYANVSYTLPGSYTDDVCRYSVVSTNVNVPTAWFNTSTYTFTPLKAGYWEIIASYDVYRNGEASLLIKKNGTTVASAGAISSVAQQITKIIYLNGSTDYINVYNAGVQANARTQTSSNAFFQARFVGA